MNRIALLLISIGFLTMQGQQNTAKQEIDTVLTQWHKAAAEADFEAYFDKMTSDGVFIGTDATENWQNDAFRAFSKPYFDRGRAWSFYALERNIYVHESQEIAWFDELLNTQMQLCRGSGVLRKIDGSWKIAHYVLSIAIPNENVTEVVALKQAKDSVLKRELVKRKN